MNEQGSTAFLQQQLASLGNSTWQEQLEIIVNLPQSPQIVKLISHRNYSSDIASLLASQNPRSKLVTTLTEYLIGLFELYCNQLTSFANLLITSDCLIRLLSSGNKVVASSANELLKCIISNTNFKEKSKVIKFVKNLEEEFLSSKSGYVREKISLYFLYIATSFYYGSKQELQEFQRRIVKIGLGDACEKVRTHMKEILSNLSHFQKQNQIALISSSCKGPSKHQSKKASRQQEPKVIYSSGHHDSLFNTIGGEEYIGESKIQMPSTSTPQTEEITLNNYRFYLERLQNGDSWAMTILTFETLISMISRNALGELNNDQLYCQTIAHVTPFLSEKRAKVGESCCSVLSGLIEEVRNESRVKVIRYIEDHCSAIIEQASKIESIGAKILPVLMDVNPVVVLLKMAEVSTQLKTHKQKQIIMDTIVKSIQAFHISSQSSSKQSKKVSSICRMMCFHITSCPPREKDIVLAALAVISQLKSYYPSEVLTTLLCQNDKTLSKIIEVAESIDESLKEAVIQYICSLKGNRLTVEHCSSKSQKSLSEKIECEIQMIVENKAQKINKIGELFMTNLDDLAQIDFESLLGLVEYLPNSDMIMQYRFLLEEIAKSHNFNFIVTLIGSLKSREQAEEDKEYHKLMFVDLLALAIRNLDVGVIEHRECLQKCCECLIQVYQASASLKIRNGSIEALTFIDEQILEEHLKQKQLQLVKTYKLKLGSQLEEEDDILNSNFY